MMNSYLPFANMIVGLESEMISSASFNMGYKGSYIVPPLAKTKIENGTEWSVAGNFDQEINKVVNKDEMKSMMGNLDDIRRADSNHDNIISLNELKACDNKTEFMEHLIFELEKFEKTWKTSNHR